MKIVLIFALVGAMMGLITAVVIPAATLGWITSKVFDIPGMKLGGELASWACDKGSDIPFFGDDIKEACWWAPLADAAVDADIENTLRAVWDCSTSTDAEKAAGLCDDNAIDQAELTGLMPADREWLILVYQTAAEKYDISWELLAATHAARSNFGDDNCEVMEKDSGITDRVTKKGGGVFQFGIAEWEFYKVDGGKVDYRSFVDARYTNDKDQRCARVVGGELPDFDNTGGEVVLDQVDAIFTQAKILSERGAKDKRGWAKWTGSPASSCKPDDRLRVYPYGGANALNLPSNIIALGDRYTFATLEVTEQHPTVPDNIPGENSPNTVPKEAAAQIIDAIGASMGMPPNILDQARPLLMAQIQKESSFRPAALQGIVDVNSGSNSTLARGMVQFVPSTFYSWQIPGFTNIYNPVHNLAAAMNAMRNSTSMKGGHVSIPGYGKWPNGTSGWSPGGTSPYRDDDKGEELSGPYKGSEIDFKNDPIARAVAKIYKKDVNRERLSDCYVAHVHDWFVAFDALDLGSEGSEELSDDVIRAMQKAMDLQEGLPYFLGQSLRSHAGYKKLGFRRNTPTNGGTGFWDCSTFTAYVLAVAANFEVTGHTDAQWTYGGGPISLTAFENDKVVRGVVGRDKPPGGFQTGDLLLYRAGAGGVFGHVIMIYDKDTAAGSGDPNKKYSYDDKAMTGYPMQAQGWIRYKAIAKAAAADADGGKGWGVPGLDSIVEKPITYTPQRKQHMAGYSKRRYGQASWQLQPKSIAMHYTVTSTLDETWNIFEPNTKNGGEFPNVCSHFIVGKDGEIWQLVPTNIRCRHVIGGNHHSIGIEVVEERSDQNILKRPAQMRAIIALIRGLQQQYDIPTSNVFGHAEFNKANYPTLYKDLTQPQKPTDPHSDWSASSMKLLRSRL